MNEIVQNMNSPENTRADKKIRKSKELIEEINDKLILLEDEELDLPSKFDEANAELALESMKEIFDRYEENEEDITIFSNKVGNIKEYWLKSEDWLGFIFNNRDLSTITDSINRLQAYTKNNDYDNAIAELAMLQQYSTENSHIMGFNFKNIF